MSSKDEKIALEFKDKNKRRVVWYKESYDLHINIRHVDVKSWQNIIPKALKTPQLQFDDKIRKTTHYYYFMRKDKKGKDLYLEVLVDYNANPACINTFHYTSNTSKARIVYY